MTDKALALRYAPILHFDRNETIPLRAAGYAVFREAGESPSFRRALTLPESADYIVEYQYYWDYDIQHMYDLEHIWVTVARDGSVLGAEASFHGRVLTLWSESLPFAQPPTYTHAHAYCQPGKHAFLPDGRLFRLLPDHMTCCMSGAGGGVLVGAPFQGAYAPAPEDDARSAAYIKRSLTFAPSMLFTGDAPYDLQYLPWRELKKNIPAWVTQEMARLKALEVQA